MPSLAQWWRRLTRRSTIDEQKLLDEILFVRGMIVGTQEALLEILKSTLSQGEVEKVVENLKRLPTVMNKAAAVLEVDVGKALPTFYEKGIAAGREPFLIRLTSSDSIGD